MDHFWGARPINVRGEVKTRFAKRCYVRFDLTVFEAGELVGIIEVKRAPMDHKTTWEETRQGSRYTQFNVPVRIVYGMEDAKSLVTAASLKKLWVGCMQC